MLLNDETRRPRRERMLITAQERGGAGLCDCIRDETREFIRRRCGAVYAPNTKYIALAIGDSNHGIGINRRRTSRCLGDDGLDICNGESWLRSRP